MAASDAQRNMVDDLVDAVVAVTNRREANDFLRAILTPRELEKIALRLRLVQLLNEGWSQRHVAEALGVSLCKITRGSRELKYGPEGFRRVLNRTRSRQGRDSAQKRME